MIGQQVRQSRLFRHCVGVVTVFQRPHVHTDGSSVFIIAVDYCRLRISVRHGDDPAVVPYLRCIRDAVHVDGNVGLAVLQGIENGDARINLAAVAVDTHVHLPGQGFRFQKFTGNITAAHVIIVLTDVTVKKDATGIGSGYHIEKSTHVTIVLAGPSLQSLRCEIRGIKSLFQTAFSSWRL